MENFFTKKRNILIISLICTALWGSAFPVVKIGYKILQIETQDIYSKIYFAGLRFFIASIMVFLIQKIILKEKIHMEKSYIKPIITLGLLQTSLQYFFFYIYADDKLDSNKILSLVLGFSGVILVNLGKDFNLSFKFIGEGFLLTAALLNTIATFYVKTISNNIEPFLISGWQMFSGSIPLLIIGKIGMAGNNLNFNINSILLIIYAAFISAVAFSLWYMLLKYNPAGKISIYRLFIPVFGSIFSALFVKGENFTINILIGLLLVILGIFTLNMNNKKSYS